MLCQLQSTVACCVVVLLAGSVRPAAQAASPSPTNVVVILADDLGWQDLGCYGADLHETPHIDQLASEGVRFTQAYAMPVCSPSRTELYDLATDPSEQHNLVEREPRQAAALRDRLHAWRKDVSAAMPTPNPDAPGNGLVP